MMPLHTMFLILVFVFALMGSLRGWAKETLVAFSVILALFIEAVLTQMVPPIRDLWLNMQAMSRFWIRAVVFAIIIVFGYASPALAQRIGAKVARERLQDILLGFFLGLLNGVLIVGSIWFFLVDAQYGVPQDAWWSEPAVVQARDQDGQPVFDPEGRPVMEPVLDEDGNQVMEIIYSDGATGLGGIRPPGRNTTASTLVPYLPPRLITGPPLFVAVALSFVFVIIVFV